MPASAASETVQQYLNAMEDRNLALAKSFLAAEFQMTFPGNQKFHSLEDLVAWSKPRYLFVNKTYQQFEQAPAGKNIIVYCFGTLSGKFPDGSSFENIRFIDRFTVSDGLLTDQQVWNDLAEYKMNLERAR